MLEEGDEHTWDDNWICFGSASVAVTSALAAQSSHLSTGDGACNECVANYGLTLVFAGAAVVGVGLRTGIEPERSLFGGDIQPIEQQPRTRHMDLVRLSARTEQFGWPCLHRIF